MRDPEFQRSASRTIVAAFTWALSFCVTQVKVGTGGRGQAIRTPPLHRRTHIFCPGGLFGPNNPLFTALKGACHDPDLPAPAPRRGRLLRALRVQRAGRPYQRPRSRLPRLGARSVPAGVDQTLVKPARNSTELTRKELEPWQLVE